MKILIWNRGPVRIPVDECLENMKLIKDSFGLEHKVDQLVYTFKNDLSGELREHIGLNQSYFFEIPTISEEFIYSHVKNVKQLGNGVGISNVFKQFYTNKAASELIYNISESYDFIVMTRLDTAVSIKSNSELWLNKGFYTNIGVKKDKNKITREYNENSFTGDQFGIADAELMKRAWDYKDIETFTRFAENSYRAEDILDQIIEMNNVPLLSMCSKLGNNGGDPNSKVGWPDVFKQSSNRKGIIV